MKIIILITALLLIIVFLSCENPVGVNANLNEEFSLQAGGSAVIKGENLRIKFISVTEDSRCPSGYLCDLAGNAKVAITIQKDSEVPVKDSLNTFLNPRESIYLYYRVILMGLEPYPSDFNTISQSDYVATFTVNRLLPD